MSKLSLIILELIALSIIDVGLSLGVQRTISKAEKTFRFQEDMKRIQAEFKALVDRKAGQEELSAKQKELTTAMSASTKHQMKAMPVVFVISIGFYFFLLPALFPSGTATYNLFVTKITYHTFVDNWDFIIFTVIISFALQLLLGQYDKRRFGKPKQAQS